MPSTVSMLKNNKTKRLQRLWWNNFSAVLLILSSIRFHGHGTKRCSGFRVFSIKKGLSPIRGSGCWGFHRREPNEVSIPRCFENKESIGMLYVKWSKNWTPFCKQFSLLYTHHLEWYVNKQLNTFTKNKSSCFKVFTWQLLLRSIY